LQDLRAAQDQLTPAQATSVCQLADEQRLLATESSGLARDVQPWEVFRLSLEGAEQQMARAADRLQQLDTSRETQAIEQKALHRLAQMVQALQLDPPEGSPPGGSGAGQGGQPPSAQPGDLRMLAQLKLLRQMQVALRDRTATLDQARREGGGLSAEAEQQQKALEREQGELAELILQMAGSDRPTRPPADRVVPPEVDTGLDPLDELLEQSLEQALLREQGEGRP
jgi:hypothetical protein